MYYIGDKGTNKRGQYKIIMFLFLLSSERTLDRRSKLCKSNETPNLLFYFLNPCIIAVPYQRTLNLRCSLSSTKSEVQNKNEKCKSWKRKMLFVICYFVIFCHIFMDWMENGEGRRKCKELIVNIFNTYI